MQYEKSCGAVVFTRQNGRFLYVIVQSREGYYGFPKGHVEPGETEEQTALREIREETGLTVALIPGFRTVSQYPLPQKSGVIKQVVYFAAEFSDQKIVFQPEELMGAYLMTYEEAMQAIQFEDSRNVLQAADCFLREGKDLFRAAEY